MISANTGIGNWRLVMNVVGGLSVCSTNSFSCYSIKHQEAHLCHAAIAAHELGSMTTSSSYPSQTTYYPLSLWLRNR